VTTFCSPFLSTTLLSPPNHFLPPQFFKKKFAHACLKVRISANFHPNHSIFSPVYSPHHQPSFSLTDRDHILEPVPLHDLLRRVRDIAEIDPDHSFRTRPGAKHRQDARAAPDIENGLAFKGGGVQRNGIAVAG
jgi:hypothetical protein